jgi:hypothetical protein
VTGAAQLGWLAAGWKRDAARCSPDAERVWNDCRSVPDAGKERVVVRCGFALAGRECYEARCEFAVAGRECYEARCEFAVAGRECYEARCEFAAAGKEQRAAVPASVAELRQATQ